jgi:hypothetical protein
MLLQDPRDISQGHRGTRGGTERDTRGTGGHEGDTRDTRGTGGHSGGSGDTPTPRGPEGTTGGSQDRSGPQGRRDPTLSLHRCWQPADNLFEMSVFQLRALWPAVPHCLLFLTTTAANGLYDFCAVVACFAAPVAPRPRYINRHRHAKCFIWEGELQVPATCTAHLFNRC